MNARDARPKDHRPDPATAGGTAWSQMGSVHPGVRAPGSVRIDDWHPFVNWLIIATFAMVTVVAFAAAWTASPFGEVTDWVRWTADSGEWSIEYPADWGVHEFIAEEGAYHLMFARSQWLRIHFIAGSDLALTTDLARFDYSEIERVHRQMGRTWATLLGVIGMDEGDVGRTVMGNQPAVWSQFRYPGGPLEGDEPMTGYRATVSGTDSGAIVSVVAPTRYWTRFRPSALRVMRSIEPAR